MSQEPAKVKIGTPLDECDWWVQHRDEMIVSSTLGIAERVFYSKIG